ncbi:MAG TPA: aldose epimerase family protein [Gemmatimonadaceae bacterium]|nr:aldose epimerase family protein [Gemmatimonadaceae bacterium]
MSEHAEDGRATGRPSIERAPFGETRSGEAVEIFTLANGRGVGARIISYGGTAVSITTPDRDGVIAEVTLCHDTLAKYEADTMATGALVGRCANRIANGRFTLDGEVYQLSTNAGRDHLHGGVRGFQRVVWSAESFVAASDVGVVLRYVSPDGEEGYPGTVQVRVTYTLTGRDELVIDYHATSDRATPVNLTQHSYFNLGGDDVHDILDHELTLTASSFTPMSARLIPTGEIRPVAGTPFDFTTPHAIGERIEEDDEQLQIGAGYDHNFVLDGGARRDTAAFAARLHSPRSGRSMDVLTTQPGLQLYTGNALGGDSPGASGPRFRPYGAVALETQHFPNAPNEPQFPSVILRPGEIFASRTVYRFSSD